MPSWVVFTMYASLGKMLNVETLNPIVEKYVLSRALCSLLQISTLFERCICQARGKFIPSQLQTFLKKSIFNSWHYLPCYRDFFSPGQHLHCYSPGREASWAIFALMLEVVGHISNTLTVRRLHYTSHTATHFRVE